jgi:hypothetical protein
MFASLDSPTTIALKANCLQSVNNKKRDRQEFTSTCGGLDRFFHSIMKMTPGSVAGAHFRKLITDGSEARIKYESDVYSPFSEQRRTAVVSSPKNASIMTVRFSVFFRASVRDSARALGFTRTAHRSTPTNCRIPQALKRTITAISGLCDDRGRPTLGETYLSRFGVPFACVRGAE